MNQMIEELNLSVSNVKKRILNMAYNCERSTHIGGSLSMADMLTVLYMKILNYKSDDPNWEERDRFILSKGHCVMALYSVLMEKKIIAENILDTFQQNGTELGAHPVMNISLGIESSNGSLGQGISMAVGIAKAAKLQGKEYKTYVMIGNGESNEGSVWEAAMLASHWKLDNLTVILDNNKLQSDGLSEDVLDMGDVAQKWKSFGFSVEEINGHDTKEIYEAFQKKVKNQPKIIIGNTIKGNGISFMKNNNEWHHNRLTKQNWELGLAELEAED